MQVFLKENAFENVWKMAAILFRRKMCQQYPADTRPNNNVIITSKRRCDVVLTLQWRYYYVACPLESKPRNEERQPWQACGSTLLVFVFGKTTKLTFA